jgi:excisionase family DNA binding protein
MASRDTADDLLTVKQFATMVNVEPQTIHRWRMLGTAPRAIRPTGGKILFRRSDVDAWLAERAEQLGERQAIERQAAGQPGTVPAGSGDRDGRG